jgi:drug/metabolite transporter (DMT)-like permease
MTEYLNQFKDWLITLGEKHGVDPLFLGCLYFISKVSLFTWLGISVKRLRAKKPAITTLLFAGISFCIPYTYIMIAGRNLPFWVYILIAFIFSYGAYTIWKKATENPKPAEDLPLD